MWDWKQHACVGQIPDKRNRDWKAQLLLLKGLEQNQGTAHAPWTQHTQAIPGHTPAFTPGKEPAGPPPPWGASKGGKLSFALPLMCCSRGPYKALPGKIKNSKLFLIHVTMLNFNELMTAAGYHDHGWYLPPFNEALLETRYHAKHLTHSLM